ncbi:hypothetical protein G6724_05500 [Polynucleobacter paneuropaeus]|nr:hypothetical protein [Polynucleobacter paneuropaeus]
MSYVENLLPEVKENVIKSESILDKLNIKISPIVEDELETELFFGGIPKDQAKVLKPSALQEREKQIQLAIDECDLLAQKAETYHQEFTVRGNRALYELLADIYSFAMKVHLSDYRPYIINELISSLKMRDIKVQANTPEMTVIVKYIVGGDRKRASNYSRVLDVAMRENLAAADLAEYISRHGGITQIHNTDLENEAKETSKTKADQRVGIFQDYFQYKSYESQFSIKYSNPLIENGNNGDRLGKFIFFLTIYDKATDSYKVINAHKFSEGFENGIFRFILKNSKSDVQELRERLKNYIHKLDEAKLLPPIFAKIREWQKNRLESIPMNHEHTDMETEESMPHLEAENLAI